MKLDFVRISLRELAQNGFDLLQILNLFKDLELEQLKAQIAYVTCGRAIEHCERALGVAAGQPVRGQDADRSDILGINLERSFGFARATVAVFQPKKDSRLQR